MRNIIFLILGIFIIQSCDSQNVNTTDWNSDLDFISKELPKKHYDFFVTKSKEYYLQGIQNIKSSTDNLSDFEISVKLQQLIASMGDSHTKVNFGQLIDKSKILPLHLFMFSDGLYILHTIPEYEEILGHRIISINQIPIEIVIDSLSTLITVDNQAIIKSSIPEILPLVQVLEYFKFTKEPKIELGLEDLHGTKKNYNIEPAFMNRKNRKMFKPDSLALCFRNERAFFIDYDQPKDKIYYIQYNKCWSKELEVKYRNGRDANRMPSFNDFEEKVFHNLETKQFEKVVFDLRFNSGGNSSQGTAFIEKFAKFADKNPEMKIFVILGRYTFSSAILNAMDFIRLTNAKFVGEETGGKPNHFGEVKNFRLPHSGLRVDYSTKYFKRTDMNENSLIPEINIETDFSDFKSGIDPVYEWIKER